MPNTITMELPSGHVEVLSHDEWRTVRGQCNQQMSADIRKQNVERCPCGQMTLARARARGHKCVKPT